MKSQEIKERDHPTVSSYATKKGTTNTTMIIIAVAVIAVVAIVGIYYLGSQSPSTQTWQQWGMGIQSPAGVQAQYSGILDQTANSGSGTVQWVWNQGTTRLALSWVNTTSIDYDNSFEAIYQSLLVVATNVSVVDDGTITMAGLTWQYATFQFEQSGYTNYETSALTLDSTNGRAYEMDFIDVNPTTLNSLMSYGNTFTR